MFGILHKNIAFVYNNEHIAMNRRCKPSTPCFYAHWKGRAQPELTGILSVKVSWWPSRIKIRKPVSLEAGFLILCAVMIIS